jgi:uracil-DNA glycosylase family 4
MSLTSPIISPVPQDEPGRDCPLCPRLVALRTECRAEHPRWWNGPVSAFGDPAARIVIIGIAPGKLGANRTGRPFTGDYAGDLLFATLAKFGLSRGTYAGRADDDLVLVDCAILNAVKCLPPQNKPLPDEVQMCRQFLATGLDALKQARIFIALGQIAHLSTVHVRGGRPSRRVSRIWPSMTCPAGASSSIAIIALATTRTPGD